MLKKKFVEYDRNLILKQEKHYFVSAIRPDRDLIKQLIVVEKLNKCYLYYRE